MANFGSRSFQYAEANDLMSEVSETRDVIAEMKQGFGALPFNVVTDGVVEGASASTAVPEMNSSVVKSPSGPPLITSKATKPHKGKS